jgi:hypothetical protein
VRPSEILHRDNEPTEKKRARPELGLRSVPFSKDLSKLVRAYEEGDPDEYSRNHNRKRVFLSKSRYMSGRQCSKKLWQSVYDPEPAEEALPGTVKGTGIEVGVKARLLWPGGVSDRSPLRRLR